MHDRLAALKKFTNRIQESGALPPPTLRRINCLTALYGFCHLIRVRVRKFDLSRQVIRVADLKKDQIVLGEVILDTPGLWSNHRFAERQIFKNPGRRVYFSKDVAVIWNDAQITMFDGFGHFLLSADPKIV